MEAEVLAALVATPAVLVTGGAAFFAGRAQARAALRGPVDSIRRSAQRDAYADLLGAAREYVRKAQWKAAWHRLMAEGALRDLSDAQIQWRVVSSLTAVPIEPVRHAVAVVSLEGPEHLVPLAEAIEQCVVDLRETARQHRTSAAGTYGERRETNSLLEEKSAEVAAAIPPFVAAARAHLNGSPPSL
ncbi:hypothetical protein G4Z16_13895 [Streptomyces bathyalis]|uniref:Uncharacterized protein n=1 Tax=Streptomyces bathyalis TaxID=2710756 RepID=A0A7T1WQS4_9ACTN|nr:hypothetical protein [Streptomyces bathyalis]QPP07298.1 hypothetical protein G4Z16_13895 [Streptomyces bathyalis]